MYLDNKKRVKRKIEEINSKYEKLMSKTLPKFQDKVKLAWNKELNDLKSITYKIFSFHTEKNYYEQDLELNPKINFNKEIIVIDKWKEPLTALERIKLKIKNKEKLTALEKLTMSAKSFQDLINDGTIDKLLSNNDNTKEIKKERNTSEIIIDYKNDIIIEFK